MARRVELVDAPRDVLVNLFQLYDHDFSEFTKRAIGDDGRFELQSAYEKAERFVIHVDGELAGFAIVQRDEGVVDPAEEVWWVAEFFVLRKFRRAGVGERVAGMLFASRPGTWEVAQLRSNTAAQAFWRRVVDRYTEGRFEEHDVHGATWDGFVHRFTS